MSEFHLEQGFRDIYGGDGDLHRPVSITGSPTSIPSPGTQYKMGQPTYRSGVYVQRDVTLPPRPAATFIRAVDPAYAVPQRTQVVYRVHDNYNTSPTRDSPPPPPYSPPRNSPTRVLTIHSNNEYQRRSGSPSGTYAAVYKTETAALPRDNRGYPKRSSSPFQERNDVETLIPTYTAPYHPTENYPAGAPSKIVYSTHLALQGKGQVSSKPTSERDESDPKQFPPAPVIASSNAFSYSQSAATTPAQGQAYKAGPRSDSTPRPYQLKPTMGAYEDGKPVGQDSPKGPAKEAEVDALTNLLIQNMEVSGDPDFYGDIPYGLASPTSMMPHGYYELPYSTSADLTTWSANHSEPPVSMCVKCGRAIMGDNSGCSALDQLFHIECFTCVTCEKCLKGHQFFAMEGKPYCEPCYMNTLEKCSVCSSPITDRILRATGKPYHPACFMCVVCGKSLDGVQFTVDATNQIHCIEDFHKKFAPRCCVCNDPVMPEPGEEETVRIVAMDRSFHIKCYKCEDCGLHLSSEADGRGCYPLDDHILCKQCNAKRIQAMTTRMMTEL